MDAISSRNLHHRSRSVYWILLFSYIAVSMIFIPLTGYSYLFLDRTIQNKVGEQAGAQLDQSAQIINGYFQSLEQSITTINMITRESSLVYNSKPLDSDLYYQISEFADSIKNIQLGNNWLYNFYVYFPNMDSIVTSSTRYNSEDYFRLFLQNDSLTYQNWIDECQSNANMVYHAARKITSYGNSREIITISTSISFENRSVRAVIFASIDVEKIRAAFNHTEFLKQGQILILQGDKIIYELGNRKFQPKDIFSSDNKNVNDIAPMRWLSIADETVLLLRSSPNESGLAFICVIPEATYLGEIETTRQFLMRILLIELLTGVIISVLVALASYSPLRRTVRQLPTIPGELQDSHNEFDMISQTANSLIMENRKISSTLRQQQPLIQASLLKQMLVGLINPKLVDLESINLNLSFPFFIVVVFQIEGTDSEDSDKKADQSVLLTYFLLDLLIEHFISFGACRATEMDARRVALIINLASDQDATAVWSHCSAFNDYWFEQTGNMLSVGISDIKMGINTIAAAYRNGCAALEYIRWWQRGNIITYNGIQHNMPSYAYSQDLENSIINGLRLGQHDAISRIVDQIIDEVNQTSIAYIRCLFFDIIGTALKLLNEMEVDPHLIFQDNQLPLEKMTTCSTLVEMKTELANILFTIANYLNHDRSSRNEQICLEIDRLIRLNYPDSSFSLTSVADALGMNPSYISHLYKKQTGCNFVDALNKQRIEVACSILGEKRVSIAQVSEQCGYLSAGYFIRIFKKVEGCTPGQYHERCVDYIRPNTDSEKKA